MSTVCYLYLKVDFFFKKMLQNWAENDFEKNSFLLNKPGGKNLVSGQADWTQWGPEPEENELG